MHQVSAIKKFHGVQAFRLSALWVAAPPGKLHKETNTNHPRQQKVQDLDACKRSLIEHLPLEHISIQVSSNDLIFIKKRANLLLVNDRNIIPPILCIIPPSDLSFVGHYPRGPSEGVPTPPKKQISLSFRQERIRALLTTAVGAYLKPDYIPTRRLKFAGNMPIVGDPA